MKQNSIKDLPRLRNELYENIFHVHKDEDNRYYYNLLQQVVLPDNLPKELLTTYDVVPGDTLPFISYKVYDTPNLWWVITHANKIDNPTIQLQPGTQLIVPTYLAVREILGQINL
jgi:nucleoid-associated protein YgaU